MSKKTANDIIELVDQLEKKIDNLDTDTASSTTLKGILDDVQKLKDFTSTGTDPMVKMIVEMVSTVTLTQIETAYAVARIREGLDARSATASGSTAPSVEELQERAETLKTKIEQVQNLSEDEVTAEHLKEILDEGRALKKDIDATDNPLAQIIGVLMENEVFPTIEENYNDLVKTPDQSQPSSPKAVQPTLYEVRQMFTKFQAKSKKVVAQGPSADANDVQEVVELAKSLKSYSQANPDEFLSKTINTYLQKVNIDGVQELYHQEQPQPLSNDEALELVQSFKTALVVVDKNEKDVSAHQVRTLIEEYKKVKSALTREFENEETKNALQEMVADITLEELTGIEEEVVRVEIERHPDPDRLAEIEKIAEIFDSKMRSLQDKTTRDLTNVEEVIALGDELENYANAHPSRIGNMITGLLKEFHFDKLKKAYTGDPTPRTANGKFDLFEDGFIAKCQKYFEDLAVNSAKKSKKYLQEAAQVMKGLPEDFKGLRAETPEENVFIENLPGQTALLSKIIERELKMKDKEARNKSAQKTVAKPNAVKQSKKRVVSSTKKGATI